jgi:hypothetical protein
MEGIGMDHQTALKAAQWWASQLKRGGADNGDNSSTGIYTMMLGSVLQSVSREKNTAEKVEKFTELLTNHLEKVTGNRMFISCDYGPDYELSRIAKEAGVDCGAFPWKTSMILDEGKIKVACGYGSPYEELT